MHRRLRRPRSSRVRFCKSHAIFDVCSPSRGCARPRPLAQPVLFEDDASLVWRFHADVSPVSPQVRDDDGRVSSRARSGPHRAAQQVINCELIVPGHGQPILRCGYGPHAVIRSQVIASEDAAAAVSEIWKAALMAQGFRIEPRDRSPDPRRSRRPESRPVEGHARHRGDKAVTCTRRAPAAHVDRSVSRLARVHAPQRVGGGVGVDIRVSRHPGPARHRHGLRRRARRGPRSAHPRAWPPACRSPRSGASCRCCGRGSG